MTNLNKYQICFDLYTSKEYEKILKEKYNKSLSSMYNIIKQHLVKNGFSWVEGSTYYSNTPISYYKLNAILRNLYEENLWLSYFTKDLRRAVVVNERYDYKTIITMYQEKLAEQELEENNQLQQNEQECDDLEL